MSFRSRFAVIFALFVVVVFAQNDLTDKDDLADKDLYDDIGDVEIKGGAGITPDQFLLNRFG